MTKISILAAASLAAALLAPGAFADTKIGYVDLRRVMAEAPQARDATATLESEFGPRGKQLQAQQKEYETRVQKFERDQPTMSDGERTKAQKDIRDTQLGLERRGKEFQEDLELRRNEELQKVQRSIVEEVQKVAKAQSYDLVAADGVIYHSDAIDLTAPVLASLQARAKATPAAPAAPAKPPKN
jgi:outer membrane protein